MVDGRAQGTKLLPSLVKLNADPCAGDTRGSADETAVCVLLRLPAVWRQVARIRVCRWSRPTGHTSPVSCLPSVCSMSFNVFEDKAV